MPQSPEFATVNFRPEDQQCIEEIKKDLLQSIEDGVQSYKRYMDELLDTKQPLKDSQLTAYHEQIRDAIKNALLAFYTQMKIDGNTTIMPYIQSYVSLAADRLEKIINAQLNEIYLRKHEFVIDSVVKMVKSITDKAEILYDELSEEFITNERSRAEVLRANIAWEQEANKLFEKLLKENKIHDQPFWKYELSARLRDRLQDLLEDYPEDSSVEEVLPPQAEIPLPEKEKEAPSVHVKQQHETPPLETSKEPSSPALNPKQSTIRKKKMNVNVKLTGSTLDQLDSPGRLKPKLSNPWRDQVRSAKKYFETPHEAGSLQLFSSMKKGKASQFIPTKMKIDIGVYMDENVFKVGVYKSNEFIQILTTSPEIFFSEKNILIGDEATHYRSSTNRVDVFQLIASTSLPSPHNILVNFITINLCAHEIIAAFLNEVFDLISVELFAEIGQVVVSMQMVATSVKERIQRAAQVVGLSNVKVLSTTITSAIATKDENLQTTLGLVKKSSADCLLFVLEYQQSSFLMGIVEIKGDSYNVISQYGSDNIEECQRELFVDSHRNLYELGCEENTSSKESKEHISNISEIYEKAADFVLQKVGDVQTYRIAVSDAQNEVVEKIMHKILAGKISKYKKAHAPFLGAALLASNSNASITIQDSNQASLELSVDGSKPLSLEYMNPEVQKGLVFRKKCLIPVNKNNNSPGIIEFQLKENFGHDRVNFEICSYEFTTMSETIKRISKSPSAGQVEITVECMKDADGLLTLKAQTPTGATTELEMYRTDNVTCQTACGSSNSDYRRLLEAYKKI